MNFFPRCRYVNLLHDFAGEADACVPVTDNVSACNLVFYMAYPKLGRAFYALRPFNFLSTCLAGVVDNVNELHSQAG